MNDERMRESMRRGVRDGFAEYERISAMRAAEEGRVSEAAYAEERKVLRRMRAYGLFSFVFMFGSMVLALWLFWTGSVGGGFGAAFVGLFFSFVHGLGTAVAKAIDEKHYWAAAYDWAKRKMSEQG